MSNTTTHFLFRQIDSWFFRESRSMDGAGSTALESLFPPPNNTLLGAIRTQIGNRYHADNGSDWKSFSRDSELAKIIGYGNDYAELKAQGAWLYNVAETQLYFPCPLNLLKQGENGLGFFQWGEPCHCDLGNNVVLPKLNYEKKQKPIENTYLSTAAFSQLLNGKMPDNQLVKKEEILNTEPRLGIARDNQRRKTEDGKLYQTKHIRLKADWQLYLGLDGVTKYAPQQSVLRLGGEARMAELTPLDSAPKLPTKPESKQAEYLILYLLTPLPDCRVQVNQPVLPNADFQLVEQDNLTLWRGAINGIELDIITAITGKAERIGGWDMARHQSLPVRSFIPAGSCWYIKTNGNTQAIIDSLHGQFITGGNDRALGYGQVVVGLAPHSNHSSI